MKTIQTTTLLLLTLFFTLSAAAFGQETKTATKVIHLGSVKLDSIKLGINRLDEIKKGLEEKGFPMAKGSSPLQKDTPVELEFVQYSLEGPTNLSQAATLLGFMGYKPATFEEAASIDAVALEKVKGQTVYALGTQMMLGNGKSLIFNFKYPLKGEEAANKGVAIIPLIVSDDMVLTGTVVLAMVRNR